MSVDPEQPPAPDPTQLKNPTEPSGDPAELIRLKRRFRKGGTESEEGENPDQTIQLLSSLLQDLIAKKEQPATPEVETAKTAKFHRLSKTGSGISAPPNEAGAAVPPATGGASEGSATPAAPVLPTPGGVVPPPAAFRPAPVFDPPEVTKRLRRWKIVCLLGVLASAAATYFVMNSLRPVAGRSDPSGKSAFASSGTWTDATLQQLDQALAADQAGDIKGAERLVTVLQKHGAASLSGLDRYVASLHSRLERTYDAEADLLRMSTNAPPVEAALINQSLAFNFSRTRDFEKASDHYNTASRLDPFSASLFYHWGETARHLGHFPDAVADFRRALDRVPTGQPENQSLRECIGLKLRLCYVEQGQEEKFQPELTEYLKAPMPSGYWLLTAAAAALQHKNLPEAAGLLGRARDALGPEQFAALLNDYFFRTYADRKELADFFPSDPAARRAKLQSTMTYSIEP